MTLKIGRTIAESTPEFHPLPKPRAGAPNVVVVVLDDLGFGQLGCFGSDIATPTIDRLAGGGLRYNRFHVTSLCSPTRACLLTGRNHHAVGMGFLTDIPTGFPGYSGRIPTSAGTLPRILRDAGYSTFAVGKWHLTPRWEERASGPFERWPLGFGFERYYGFLGGDTNQWTPELVSDNQFVEPPRRPEAGYHLTEDLADRAIRMVQDQKHASPAKPFFLYFATGAMHAPHHVAEEWSDRYRGRFDHGWEAWRNELFARQRELGVVPPGTRLTERPSWVRDWESVAPDERRLYARQMEVFAGFLSHTDHQIGRLVDFLDQIGELDNTLVFLLSDNGTSAEGGPIGSVNEHRFTHDFQDDLADSLTRVGDLGGFRAYNHYAWGWAWAGNTPLRLWKRYTWLGGVRTPLIVHWPAGIAAGATFRPQFCHAIDIAPTVLDVTGVAGPDAIDGVRQQPFDGASLTPSFADAGADGRDTQYFEMVGSRALYHDGWKITTDHVGKQLSIETELLEGSHDFDEDHWALFRLDDDFSEAQDVSAEHPDVVRRLVELWWMEAGRNQVLPLDDSLIGRAVAIEPPPSLPRFRNVYLPGGGPVAEDALPPLGAGFELIADVEVPSGRVEGIVCALGDWNNGWAFYLLDGRPVVVFNLFGNAYRTEANAVLAAGAHSIGFGYTREHPAGGPVRISIDREPAGEGRLPADLPFRWQIGVAGLLLGHDRGFPVSDDYQTPFPFSGTISRVVIEIPVLAPLDADADLAASLHRE